VHECKRTSFWAGSMGLLTEPIDQVRAYGRLLGGGPPHAAGVLINRGGCELVALNSNGRCSIELTGELVLGGFVERAHVHVLIPASAAIGDRLALTSTTDVAANWPNVTVHSSATVTRPIWELHSCTRVRYWRHRGARQPVAPQHPNIVWLAGPADTLPPPEPAGHTVRRSSGRIVCAWCGTQYTDRAEFIAACAPDAQ
jgi:hypothetical protein